jgi:DNA gyrase subunit A
MFNNLGLRPEHAHRKSAAVVGEVLAKFHPHGDIACYEAMVRMAQDFSLRYPLVDGQGNFGSLDGDNAAAYRYTEARLRQLAVEVIGEIGEETVEFRDNFDGTTQEPVVFPSRVPNLVINGASGIAVGMATSIPPHNLRDTVKALIELSRDPELSTARLTSLLKAPDFPTGCQILNSKTELENMYRTGKGSVRMRGEWEVETAERGKRLVVIRSIPYAINKAQLVEKIADIIVSRKVPQLVDVRDESTEEVRIVLELAPAAEPEIAMAYLFKHTPLESTFSVNLTVLVPTGPGGAARPELLSLKQCLRHFLDFREEVTVKRLVYEKKKLLERIHILEGLLAIFDSLDEAIAIVRKSDGRSDAAQKLRDRFSLSEIQAFAVVDMRIYQLSRTNIKEIRDEHGEKRRRVKAIETTLADKEQVLEIVRTDLEKVAEKFGDKRLCPIVRDAAEIELNAEDYVVEEDVHAIITKDGWLKRVRQNNEVSGTRLREGDAILYSFALSTKDYVAFITNQGSVYSLRVSEFPASGGYGDPVQKLLKFRDGERVIAAFASPVKDVPGLLDAVKDGSVIALISKAGLGHSTALSGLYALKRSGKRLAKAKDDDELVCAIALSQSEISIFSRKGYGLRLKRSEVPHREGVAGGVALMGLRDGDAVVGMIERPFQGKVALNLSTGRTKEISWSEVVLAHRDTRGTKLSGNAEIDSVAVPAATLL